MTVPTAPLLPHLTCLTASGRSGGTPTPYLALAQDGEVRSLLPAHDRRLLRRSLARPNGPESRPRYAARCAYAVLASGAAPVTRRRILQVDDTGLRQVLAPAVGRDPHEVALSFYFGPPRANRKPVVLVLDRTGTMLGVAKVSVGPLTRRLVEQETETLRRLAALGPHPGLLVPELLAASRWGRAQVMVQSALALPGRPRVPGEALRRRAEDALVRAAGGPSYDAAGFAAAVDLPAPHGPAHAVLERLRGEPWLAEVATGASHGDWSPQNITPVPGGVAAWDWERFSEDRPLGYDAAHLVLMQELRRTSSGGNLLGVTSRALAPWQAALDPARLDDLARLVLLDLLARYAGEGQAEASAAGRHRVDLLTAAVQGPGAGSHPGPATTETSHPARSTR